MEIQTAVHVENTEQKEHCGNAVEPKFTLFYEELLFHLFVQQGVIKKYFHCKLHQLNKHNICIHVACWLPFIALPTMG